MKREFVWYSILVLFAAGFAGFVVGFGNALAIGMAVTQPSGPGPFMPAERPPGAVEAWEPSASEGIQLVVLGDSLARGTGDPAGEGFAGRVAQGLEERGEMPVVSTNFAVEGMRSADLAGQLADAGILQGVADASYIILSIGGNDLRDVARRPPMQQDEAFEASLRSYADNLNSILLRLRQANDQALILFIGLYGLEDTGRQDRESAYLLEWNYVTQQLLEADGKGLFIPTRDLFQLQLNRHLSLDGLHPSVAGYEAIADRILGSLPE